MKTQESLIDHLWSTDTLAITSGKVAEISDQAGIYLILPDTENTSSIIPVIGRSYKEYDAKKAQTDFQNTLGVSIFKQKVTRGHINNAAKALVDIITSVCNRNAL